MGEHSQVFVNERFSPVKTHMQTRTELLKSLSDCSGMGPFGL